MDDLEKRVSSLEKCMVDVSQALGKIQGSQQTVELLLKWVVMPLLIIVGALVGVKIALP